MTCPGSFAAVGVSAVVGGHTDCPVCSSPCAVRTEAFGYRAVAEHNPWVGPHGVHRPGCDLSRPGGGEVEDACCTCTGAALAGEAA